MIIRIFLDTYINRIQVSIQSEMPWDFILLIHASIKQSVQINFSSIQLQTQQHIVIHL